MDPRRWSLPLALTFASFSVSQPSEALAGDAPCRVVGGRVECFAPVCQHSDALEGPQGRGFTEGRDFRGVPGLVWPVTTLIQNGPSDNRIDLAFAGDGYTAAELATTYTDDVNTAVDGMFQLGTPALIEDLNPYVRYAKFFNVHRVDVPSNESGIDLIDGTMVDTKFDCGQWDATIPRLARCDYGLGVTVINESMAAVGIDIADDGPRGWRGLALNTDIYTNAGALGLSVFAGHNEFIQPIFLHEASHSWNNIADEYGGNPGIVYSGAEPEEVNATADISGAKWAAWLGFPQVTLGVNGVYEGGRYYDLGLYRPTMDSIMRFLLIGWNAVCIEKTIQDIYAIVDPLDDWTDDLPIYPASGELMVNVVDPAVVLVDWKVDGNTVVTAGPETYSYDVSGLGPGLHTVTAVAYDELVNHSFSDNASPHPLDLVRGSVASMQQSITWTVGGSGIPVPVLPTPLLALLAGLLIVVACWSVHHRGAS